MEDFPYMKQCLHEFDYPNIHALSDLDIAEVFSTENRPFLVCWIFRQMDAEYAPLLDKITNEELADLVHCHGFCSNAEKTQFINGQLPVNQQLKVIYQMLYNLKEITQAKQSTVAEGEEIMPVEEVTALIKMDTNLFPMDGPKKTLNPEERRDKIEEYYREIERLKAFIHTNQSDQTKEPVVLSNDSVMKLEECMEFFKKTLPEFRRKCLEIAEHQNLNKTIDAKFAPESSQILNNCRQNMEVVLEYMKNMNLIVNFDPKIENSTRNNDHMEMLKEISNLCEELNQMSKE